MKIVHTISALFLAAVTAACQSVEDVADLAITDAIIIDVRTGDLLADRTILVTNNRIVSIAPSQEAVEAQRIINAKGLYVIPGLWDMHVHFCNSYEEGSDLEQATAEWLPQYVAFDEAIAAGTTTSKPCGAAAMCCAILMRKKRRQQPDLLRTIFGGASTRRTGGTQRDGPLPAMVAGRFSFPRHP